MTKDIGVAPGDTLLLGTTKGAFVARARDRNGGWDVAGPHFPGEEVYAMAYDDRAGRSRLWAAPGSPFRGTTLRFSDDFGATPCEHLRGRGKHPLQRRPANGGQGR